MCYTKGSSKERFGSHVSLGSSLSCKARRSSFTPSRSVLGFGFLSSPGSRSRSFRAAFRCYAAFALVRLSCWCLSRCAGRLVIGRLSCFNPSGFSFGLCGSASPCLLARFSVVPASGAIMSSVYFGGSRSLAPSPIVGQVVSAVLASGQSVSVGCATGADQQVIQSVSPSSFSQFRVFAAFSQSGAGSWSGSAVRQVQQFAAAGGSVSWLAGGGLQVPIVARLMSRSVAGLAGASAAVFFSPGVGSLKVAGVAVQRGIPVFAFSQSTPGSPRGCAGSWVSSSFQAFPCWQWSSAQLSLL